MRKPVLNLTSTAQMSQNDWLAFRDCGIGASDVGVVMGLSQYKASIKLFYEKIGLNDAMDIENIAMFMGKEQEAFIAKMWQYWDGSEASLIENYRAGNMVRRMRRINTYVQNPKYPHLFVSLDRIINKHSVLVGEKIIEKGQGALEIKTLSGYESEKWESGLPPSHVVQVQTQLIVTGFKYGEIAVLKDGRFFEVYPFEKHAGVCREIIKQTTDFWNRVKEGRKLVTKIYEARNSFNTKKVREFEAELYRIEPEPDGSDAFVKFLKEKYRDPEPKSERMGTDEEFLFGKKHAELKEKERKIKADIQLQENNIKARMQNFECLTFGDNGRIYWKNDAAGSRRFTNKIIL